MGENAPVVVRNVVDFAVAEIVEHVTVHVSGHVTVQLLESNDPCQAVQTRAKSNRFRNPVQFVPGVCVVGTENLHCLYQQARDTSSSSRDGRRRKVRREEERGEWEEAEEEEGKERAEEGGRRGGARSWRVEEREEKEAQSK
eukprot:1696941-Rhodomonas_salina.1